MTICNRLTKMNEIIIDADDNDYEERPEWEWLKK